MNIRKALTVFQKVLDNGERNGENFELNGLRASYGFDGYTATLSNDYVTLTIQFHQRYSFEYSSTKEKLAFIDKIEAMSKTR